MRGGGAGVGVRSALMAAALAVATPLAAQVTTPAPTDGPSGTFSSVVMLDRERLFEDSQMGRAILARIEAASAELIAENRRLEAALEAEERSLTDQRAALPPEQFRTLARDFDTKVEDLRVAQEVKSRSVTRMRDTEQQRFFELAVPVLGALMQDLGAVAIIDRSAVILSFDRIDITDQAIARLDAELGDGAALLLPPEGGEAQGPVPEQVPQAPEPAPVQP